MCRVRLSICLMEERRVTLTGVAFRPASLNRMRLCVLESDMERKRMRMRMGSEGYQNDDDWYFSDPDDEHEMLDEDVD
jgi:hypothetical protein